MREAFFLKLRQRAEAVLNNKPQKTQTISYEDIYDLINDLNLRQVELELLNDDLQNVMLELEESRSRYTDLYNFIPFGYFTFNQHGHIIEANEAGANLFGLKRSQIINKNLMRYIAPNFQYIFTSHCENVLSSITSKTCELKLLRRDGPLFYAQFHSKVVQNMITGEKNIITFVFDITDHKQQEKHIHYHQNKIAAVERDNTMGELASIIVHELNHPLSVISNYLNGCIRRLEFGKFNIQDIVQALKQASEQSHRIAEIVLRMKNFVCHGTIQYEPTSINELIQETICFLNHEICDATINIEYHPVKNLPFVLVDKIHIQQVILHLARNAIESMCDANIDRPKLIIEVNQISTSEIEINIIDNGPGILLDSAHELFNPYFTTKPYGVGLGLAVSRKIVKAHNSTLIAEQNPFGGACFKFNLPIYKNYQTNSSPLKYKTYVK